MAQNIPVASIVHDRPMLLTIFASIKSIRNFTIEELINGGIGTIFIGVESLNEEVLLKEGLTKRKGEVYSIIEELHNHGINTLGSLVIGWDSQTAAIAKADSEKFISTNPTFYQVIPLHAVPGTKLWENMKKEGRISDDYKVELDSIIDFNFEAKSYSHSEARDLVLSTYSKLVNEGGPWPLRLFENLLKGYMNLKENDKPTFVNRANIYKTLISPVYIIAFASRFFFVGKSFRKKWSNSMAIFRKNFPWRFSLAILLSPLVAFLLVCIYFYGNIRYLINPKGDQPDYLRMQYD